MARNGKVRNQAPKQAKKERPRSEKLLVGRAKKRQQYKRRIVNADDSKRKVGPNAGSGKPKA